MPHARISSNPFLLDPSRTTSLKAKFQTEYVRRVQRIINDIDDLVRVEDAFSLKDPMDFALNTRWRFKTSGQKIAAFRTWLQEKIDRELISKDRVSEIWTERYVKAAYEKGRVRGDSQAARARRHQHTQFITRYTREQQRKIEQLVQESLADAEGLGTRLKQKASRIVSDSLAKGESKAKLAGRLVKGLGIEKQRAKVIARTETVRAQAEGQLDSFEDAGITRVGALVEWTTSGLPNVCPLCEHNEGKVFTIKQARGLIPLHPQCNCGWTPVVNDTGGSEPAKPRKRGKGKAVRNEFVLALNEWLLNFNPNHEPGGSPVGGQFSSGGGSGSGSGGADGINAPVATDAEKAALKKYQGGSFSHINKALRTGKKPSKVIADNIRLLDSAISKNNVPNHTEAFRTDSWSELKELATGAKHELAIPAYLSTTTNRSAGTIADITNDHRLTIKTEGLTHGINLNKLGIGNRHAAENEILLQRGLLMRLDKSVSPRLNPNGFYEMTVIVS